MGIRVTKSGLLDTIQDLGRHGYQRDGIIVSGAMDALALRIGNLLLGNSDDEAGIEISMIGGAFAFETSQLISITGADLSAEIDGRAVKTWSPVFVKKGQILKFGRPIMGSRAYITLSGGFELPMVLSSRSTYLRAAIGGWNGRALTMGDEIPFRKRSDFSKVKFNWSADLHCYPDLTCNIIRFTPGPHADWFSNDLSGVYQITSQADRMGYRLEGNKSESASNKDLLSTAVTFGTIQMPPDGQPIILMADHQTTGGYPIVGQVISVDLPLLAQKKSGDQIHLQMVNISVAQNLLNERERYMKQFKQTMNLKYGY